MVTGRLKAPNAYQSASGEARASLELEIDEIGPSLRYATAAITRRAREAGAGAGAAGAMTNNDPWGDPSKSTPAVSDGGWANPGAGSAGADETPF